MDINEEVDEHLAVNDGDGSWASANFSAFEQECVRELDRSACDVEGQFSHERDLSSHKVWVAFQNAALGVAQLYKDRHQGVSLWLPFQNVATNVTTLYKECVEAQKRRDELGLQLGAQRRNKEVLTWLRKRKRSHIRRDEVIAFLSGKTKPARPSWSIAGLAARNRHDVVSGASAAAGGSSSLGVHAMRSQTHPHNITLTCLSLADSPTNLSTEPAAGGDLQTFRDALSAVAMAGIRSSHSPQSNFSSNSTSYARRTSSRTASGVGAGLFSNQASVAELNAFINDEYNRHVEAKKRTSTDVLMESPTHKKPKFL